MGRSTDSINNVKISGLPPSAAPVAASEGPYSYFKVATGPGGNTTAEYYVDSSAGPKPA
jgi:hypothetical protein